MATIDKKTLKKLDKINCSWLFEQISVGNIVRGLAYVVTAFGEVGKCIKATAEQIKEKVSEEKEKLEEEETNTAKASKSTKSTKSTDKSSPAPKKA